MSNELRQREELISRYADGAMDEAELAAFRARLQEDETLRREVAMQEAIDGSLKRIFGEAPTIAAPAPGTQNGWHGPPAREGGRHKLPARDDPGAPSAPQRNTGRRSVPRWAWASLAAAAVLLIAGAVGWQTGVLFPPGAAQQLYAAKQADGFSIVWACETDQQFIEQTKTIFNQPLIADSTPTARIVGWDYVPETWDASLGLLVGEVGQEHVLVVIEPTGCRGELEISGGRGLHVFSRRVGMVTLHEITPLDHAGTLDLFRVP